MKNKYILLLRCLLVCAVLKHSLYENKLFAFERDLLEPSVDDLVDNKFYNEVQELEGTKFSHPEEESSEGLFPKKSKLAALTDVDLVGLVAKHQPPKMNWCWASTAQMAIEYRLKKKISLCGVVSKVLKKDCCNLDNLDVCNQRGYPAAAGAIYGLQSSDEAASTQLVNAAMLKGRVPIIRLHDEFSDTYHVALVKSIQDKGDKFLLYDPYEGTLKVSRRRMESRSIYGSYKWVSTYVLW